MSAFPKTPFSFKRIHDMSIPRKVRIVFLSRVGSYALLTHPPLETLLPTLPYSGIFGTMLNQYKIFEPDSI